MFVGERREGDGREPAALQPVDSGGIDGHGLLSSDVGPILQIVVLSFLLCLEVEPGEATQVLLAHCLVHSGSTTDPLSVVVSSVGPPISFTLHISQDHVLHGDGQSRHLQWSCDIT